MMNFEGMNVYQDLNSCAAEYKSLINAAEELRERNGEPTMAEFDCYDKAEQVCLKIINRFHNQHSIVAKWEGNRRDCVAKGNAIADALAPPKKPHSASRPAVPSSKAPGVKSAEGKDSNKRTLPNTQANEDHIDTEVKTKSGFVTKNASKDIPAETIESWYREKPKHGVDDLSGMDELVDKLMTIAGDLGFTETDALLKIAPEKGILLYGFHGNGKTHTIEAFANYMMNKVENMKFIQLRGDQIHASLVGVAEKTIAAAFQEAIDNAPAILFFDELDNIAPSRADAKAEHSKRTTNAFLENYTKLVNAHKPVVVFGATNNPWLVDTAAMNRYSTKILVPLPCEEARQKFMERRFEAIQMEDDISFAEIAGDTDNFDFRDLGHLADGLANLLKKDAKETIADKALPVEEQDRIAKEALKKGEVKINKARYDLIRSMYHASVTEEERQKLEQYAANLDKNS